jgi:hypothetical protein
MGESKRRKKYFDSLEVIDLNEFAKYILPAAPMSYLERTVNELVSGKGLHNIGKEIIENEIKARKYEQRSYTGLEPMDKYLEATMMLKLEKKISSTENTRMSKDETKLVYAIFNREAEMVGILKVAPLILQNVGEV